MIEGMFESNPSIEIGSVGWEEDDETSFYDAAEFDNDGNTLVRVQLFKGRDFTQPLKDRAQGHKMVCVLPDGQPLPKLNSRCYIAIPHGYESTPGAAVIIATVGGGNERRRRLNPGDLAIGPRGDDHGEALILAKQDGSITLHTTDTNTHNGNSVFLRVSPTAIQFVAPWGRMIFDATGVHWTTASGARLDMGGVTIPGLVGPLSAVSDMFGAYATLRAPTVKLQGSTILLGVGAAATEDAPATFVPIAVSPKIKSSPSLSPIIPPADPLQQSHTVWVSGIPIP